jgi:hypothetical protein
MRGRLLIVAALALVVVAIVLWHELNAPLAIAAPQPAAPAAAMQPVAPAAAAPVAKAIAKVAEATTPDQSGKLDPASDAFYYKFTEVVPVVLTREAMRKCYHGGLHRVDRDASLTLDFTETVKNGEYSISDIKINKQSTMSDGELKTCFINVVSKTHWHDDSFPDFSQQDQITINPERSGRKYLPENTDYDK